MYCKLPTNGKQLPAFPLKAVMGIEPQPQRWEAGVLPLCHRGPPEARQSHNLICKPWTTPSITISKNSSVHAHCFRFRRGNFKHLKTSIARSRDWTFCHSVTSSHLGIRRWLKDRAVLLNDNNHRLYHLHCERLNICTIIYG